MFIRIRQLALCIALFGATPQIRASALDVCRDAFARIFSGATAKSKDPLLQISHPLHAKFREAVKHSEEELRGVSVIDDIAWLKTTEKFTEEEFRELFRHGARWITPQEFEVRLEALGAQSGLASYRGNLSEAYRHWMTEGKPPQKELQRSFESMLEKYRLAAEWPNEKRRAVAQELSRRREMADIEEFYDRPSLYQAKIEGDRVRFPDGRLRRIIRRSKNGDLTVAIPMDSIVRTQDFLDSDIVTDYIRDPALKKMTFDGLFLPDGRVLIHDQHHRSAAYARSVSRELPFLLKREGATNGYPVHSHLYVLKFFTSWMSLSEEGKAVLLRHARASVSASNDEVLAPMRDFYYEMTRFSRSLD